MKAAIIILVLGVYLILAFIIARLCAVNAGWERIARVVPGKGERGRDRSTSGPIGTGGDLPGTAKPNG